MKKILLLGGAAHQVPAIQYANSQGYYTILCDYLSDNPGQHYADEYHCISTTDMETVLQIAAETEIDGIVAYASDPAALTAAYVGNRLHLPSHPYESVLILTRKDLLRKFLRENGFNCPRSASFSSIDEVEENLHNICYPSLIKPVDSSGSKGVYMIKSQSELREAFSKSLSFSRARRVIVEEYIEMDHECMLGGDAFVVKGRLEFCGFLNSHRDHSANPLLPIGTSYPVFLDTQQMDLAKREIQKVLDLLHLNTGALNLELMFDKKGKVYIIEIGPRNGGNMIPELLKLITGFDSLQATIEFALGNESFPLASDRQDIFISTYVLHSSAPGRLKDIKFNAGIEQKIIGKNIYKNKGDLVEKFDAANKAIGIVFLEYKNLAELRYVMNNMDKFIQVELL